MRESKGAAAQLIVLAVVIVLSLMLVGGLSTTQKPQEGSRDQDETTEVIGSCCDTGDGDKCKPKEDADNTFDFNGEKYGLLKSKIRLAELMYHLKDTGQTYKGDPIIENTTDTLTSHPECSTGGNDLVWKKAPTDFASIATACAAIPDDEILYVCKDKCESNTSPYAGYGFMGVNMYGQPESEYDVYFKLADKDNIPDVIKNCDKSAVSIINSGKSAPIQIIITPEPIEKKSLELNTFKIINIKLQAGSTPWMSPYCKPAIYLYPPQKTNVLVKIAPKGPITLTIPRYPISGWDVTAYPNGQIDYKNTRYDYLYYEAEIPNSEFSTNAKTGFVVEYEKLTQLLDDLLPKLGLNKNEQSEFVEYWTKVLPESPYYFVGVTPKSTLDTISPLAINPKPETVIRVTLYFEALDAPISVEPPYLPAIKRTGFTLVEWGGLFKRDKNHPFTCLM